MRVNSRYINSTRFILKIGLVPIQIVYSSQLESAVYSSQLESDPYASWPVVAAGSCVVIISFFRIYIVTIIISVQFQHFEDSGTFSARWVTLAFP